jgi:hypothetical protein
MSFIRYKDIGPTTILSSTTFVFIDLSNGIDMAEISTRLNLETNPLHIVVKWTVADNVGCNGNFYTFHFTLFCDNKGDYIYNGIGYSEDCPIKTTSDGDWGEFTLAEEGVFLSFEGDEMRVITSALSVNGIELEIRGYIEIYGESDVL